MNRQRRIHVHGEAEERPDCQISGCDRPGAVAHKTRSRGSEEPVRQQYVCRFHGRVITGLKVLLVMIAVGGFLGVVYVL